MRRVLMGLFCLLVCACQSASADERPRDALVKWGSVYYPATIKLQSDGRVAVSYIGYGPEHDEVVSSDRVVVGKRLDGKPIFTPPKPYDFREARAGDKISVEWQGSWWDAQVEHVLSNKQIVIHYDGYGHEWDELVGAQRVRTR